ncbi:MAG: speB [Micavibrio sp.]|nr:speB [Micavibrio sp.]
MKIVAQTEDPSTLKLLPAGEGFLEHGPDDRTDPAKAQVRIIPFGLEHSVSYGGGTAAGPLAILSGSHELEKWDEEFWCEPVTDYGICTLDTEAPIPHNNRAALVQLEGIVEEVLEAGKFPFILGGEHTLTAGAIRPHARRAAEKGETLTILQFDAHGDLRSEFRGETFSHAAAMYHCLEPNPNTLLVAVGIRSISKPEIPFLESNKDRITTFWGKDIGKWTAEEVAKAVGTGPVYITFDIDAFDSSMIPATGTPEPGGLFWHHAMDILRLVGKHANVVGADLVELAPAPGLHACEFLASKLAYKMLTYSLYSKR